MRDGLLTMRQSVSVQSLLTEEGQLGFPFAGISPISPVLTYQSQVTASSGDNILIVNLEQRDIVGEIPIQAGATPQQIAVVNENKMYVTCAADA